MKVIHVNVCASIGSTGKIVTSISKVLKKEGHQSLVCYGANENIKNEDYYRFCPEYLRKINAIISRISGVMYGNFVSISTNSLIKKIEKEKPDIVHLHCINGFTVDIFKLLKYLAVNKYNVVLTLHAEFMYTGLCSHAYSCDKWIETGCYDCPISKKISKSIFDKSSYSWNKLKRIYSLFDPNRLKIVSVSPWLSKRAQQSVMLKRFDSKVIFNGIDTSVFKNYTTQNNYLREKLPNKFCLFVTASFSVNKNDNKGGYYLIELAKRNPTINFVVVSNYNEVIQNLPDNVLFIGHVSNQKELADLYNLANISLIFSKRETFSMVTAESLCCGTPVIGFKSGGPESIALGEYSEFTEYGDINALETSMLKWYNLKLDGQSVSKRAINVYSDNVMTERYLDIYNSLICKNRK